ncbi:ABC transporter permease [Bacillus canaveralius]|uniref:ABC transporter permease n=1 Tax=Bacillus canaveralius TaxID=1403243 RepID=A0A2N5GQT6_9BACI|nr:MULTISPECIES: carbohydrate ABC transporter permease [Bacillus]PLR85599.1 ABC transporter permease [Bacillus canaveralius]PLR86438.1 ABC transporter permease [Bacillus sp. V33-4]PLR94740.1 ABC transporter permease [Bacillus canaveralius]RSK54724.1 carbohydrate ABC transporter permease [Bacillus canaveralius]
MKIFKGGMLAIYALLIIIPIVSIFFTTFKSSKEMYDNILGLPSSFTFDNYIELFASKTMSTYFMNSVIVTIFSVTFTLFFASLIAYALTRMSNWFGNSIFALFTLGMMVPAQVNMSPLYDLVYSLGLTNTRIGLIVVNTAVTLPVAVFILTGFMKSLPRSLFEASMMDGASNWAIYRRIAIPLSLPSLAATSIFLFVMHWNDLFYPLLFITENKYKTLPLALLEFQGEYITNYPMLFTGVIIASAPMVIAYVFLQRYFIAGMTAGSVKG